ncbi:hypothetical protein GCM10008174_25320 [Methylopila turkensis]|uniref:Uncharacterized protein n=1 Tax=Methylopila turkensis TaxID=1437816 RepID=A0A9W6JNB9_9HYPH|nr:hypothetical protein GCM10008174_25320 [Methylopila turkensis]
MVPRLRRPPVAKLAAAAAHASEAAILALLFKVRQTGRTPAANWQVWSLEAKKKPGASRAGIL